VLEVSGRTKNELVSIGFDLTKMTRADYERLKRDRDDDNNDRDNNNGDKSSRVRFMRKLSWSHKAPSLDILDQTQIRLGGRGSKKKDRGKQQQREEMKSIADQLVSEIDDVVDKEMRIEREGTIVDDAIENAIVDAEEFRRRMEQGDPGWTEEDRELEASLETKWLDNPEEDISVKWHNAYEEKYSAGIVDDVKKEALGVSDSGGEYDVEGGGRNKGPLTFGDLLRKDKQKKSSSAKKTRMEKQLKNSDDVLNVVLVGNGRSVLKKNNGKAIDSADVVGRFNYFETKGFETKIGKRLDLWFLGELRQPGPQGSRGSRLSTGRMNMKLKPTLRYIVPVVYETPSKCSKVSCKPSNSKLKERLGTIDTVKKAYAKYGIKKMLEIMPIEVQHKLTTKYAYTEHWPSSGILAIVYCLEKYPKATVSITGYDFLGLQLGHYWEKVKKKGTVHSMKGEAKFIEKLVKSGRVKIL